MLNSLLEIEGRPCVSHPLGSHLSFAKDKHGMAKAILKMPYRRRQEDQPSVDYPSDMEEDRLPFGNNNPIVNGKLNYQNGVPVVKIFGPFLKMLDLFAFFVKILYLLFQVMEIAPFFFSTAVKTFFNT